VNKSGDAFFFEWSSPCVSTCPPVLGQASNFTTTSPQLSRTRARVREHEEYIVPERERKRGRRWEWKRERERYTESLGPSRVQTERIVRARAYRMCVRRATPLRVKAVCATRYKNKILNPRQLRARNGKERNELVTQRGPSFRNLGSTFHFSRRMFTIVSKIAVLLSRSSSSFLSESRDYCVDQDL